ncbi:DDB1- and CUL4-associated factor 10 [Labeo rohita]|uniref:DDB1- and CUL4-associated factor 10 n=1 Tax=Labeo rohita TaxID=84645 RepID=A0A498N8A5_LABRO|nr:DDB1- and CUL4-associated factor 10 [Labeo rohita]
MSSGQPSDNEVPEEPRTGLLRDEEEEDDSDEDKSSTRPSSPQAGRESVGMQGSSKLELAADGGTGSGCRVSSACDSLFSWICKREVRRGPYVDPARDHFRTMTRLYSSMSPATDSVNLSTQTHGAVFNLEYSPDGFLDNRLFATCSDDTTIALWDLRKLNSKVCSLHGHASWVKNIEYDTHTRLLVTSGFDGNVITWDTNRFTEDGCPHKKFFHTRYLMRMRLTPDCSKMLISTSSGYLLILHDLDLTQSLEVGSYRILRARRAPLSTGLSPRNSLEVLTPEIPGERDRGNCITSLQLHPKGWATLLRCSSNMDDQEWTCVYEFQEGAPPRPPVSPRCSLRLTHYIEEANVGRGYIKELCFSPDGRLICSPYGYGVRLLAFDEHCAELADCMPVRTAMLREIRSIYSHSDVVLTSKFSPTHCQFASGCLSGRVALYQPHF